MATGITAIAHVTGTQKQAPRYESKCYIDAPNRKTDYFTYIAYVDGKEVKRGDMAEIAIFTKVQKQSVGGAFRAKKLIHKTYYIDRVAK